VNLLEWYIPIGLLALLLWVLFRRRIYRVCPWFFAYSMFAVGAGIVRFSFHTYLDIYRTVYWVSEAGYDILGILVMFEAFQSALGTLARTWRTRLGFPLILLLSLALAVARSHTNPTHVNGIPSYIVTGEVAVRFVQVLVFAGLVTLVPLLGLRWHQYSFGVATGFGLYSTVMLLTTTKLSDFGTRFKFLWSITSLVAYSVSVLIWIWFFSAPQKADLLNPELPAPSPTDLKQYKDALRRMR
jgi:hypothetical protein